MYKKIASLLLVLLFAVSMLTAVPVLGADYTAITLEETVTEIAIDGTSRAVVHGKDATGTKTAITEGVTYSVSNLGDAEVIRVDSSGNITTQNEGLAVLTAKYGDLTATVMIVVGKATAKNGFDTEAETSGLAVSWPRGLGSLTDAEKKLVAFKDTTELSTELKHSGAGSMHLKLIDTATQKDTAGNLLTDALKTAITNSYWARIYLHAYKNTNHGVAQWWFYDDGAKETSFWIIGVGSFPRADGSDGTTQSIRGNLNIAANGYSFKKDGAAQPTPDILKTIPKSKGWHQFILDASSPDRYAMYIDGETMYSYTETGRNTGIPTIQIDRTITAAKHDLWIDDWAMYDITRTKAEYQNFTSIDIAHTKDLYAAGESAKVKIIGYSANGEYDLSDSDKATYSVDYPYTATVTEDGTITAVKDGYTILTVTVTNPDGSQVSDKMMLTVSSSKNVQNFDAYTIPSPELNDHVAMETSNTRFGAQSLKIKTKTNSDATIGQWGGFDLYTGQNKETSMTTAWFYDTGETSAVDGIVPGTLYIQGANNRHLKQDDGSWVVAGTYTAEFYLTKFKVGVESASHQYYYIQNYDCKAVREDVLPGLQVVRDIPGKDNTGYIGEPEKVGTFYTDGTKGMPLIQRSKGWHQVSVLADMGKEGTANIGTDKGSTKIFLDGELIFEEKYVSNGYGCIRACSPSGGYGLYDDLYSAAIGNEGHVWYAKLKYNVGANGSVKVGETAKTNGQEEQVEVGENVTLTLIPDAGYRAKVTVNGVDAPVSSSNQVTVENIQADTEIAVSFELIPVTPSISGSGADYIVKETAYEGDKTAYVAYYKMILPATAVLGDYGMYFNEKGGAEENKVRLVAKGKNEANMFGVRVFGTAVKADGEYTFKGFAVIDGEEYVD